MAVAHVLTILNRHLAAGIIKTATKGRLAVDSYELSVADFMQRSDPTEQTLLELSRFDGRENRVKAIMRRNPIGQIEKRRQPLAFRSAELRDRNKIVCPADHRTDGDHDNSDQWISDLTAAGIRKAASS